MIQLICLTLFFVLPWLAVCEVNAAEPQPQQTFQLTWVKVEDEARVEMSVHNYSLTSKKITLVKAGEDSILILARPDGIEMKLQGQTIRGKKLSLTTEFEYDPPDMTHAGELT